MLKRENMRKVNEIPVDEIKEVFSKCTSNLDVIRYYGYKNNGSGQRFVKQLREKAEIDYHVCFKKLDKEHYDMDPKRCACCDKVLPYEKRNNKFCSNKCAAVYNNIKRGKRSLETRVKISETQLKHGHLSDDEIQERLKELRSSCLMPKKCLNCGKETNNEKFCCTECSTEYRYKEKVTHWISGESSPTRGATQIPNFIKRYLMELHDNKCENCGWGETNETTGKIPLEVHHIDGNCTNNKIENLQLLCPNCHSLTPNFGSLNKNSKRFHRKKKTLNDKV